MLLTLGRDVHLGSTHGSWAWALVSKHSLQFHLMSAASVSLFALIQRMYLNFDGTCKSGHCPQISYQVLSKIQKQPKNKSTLNLSHSNPLMRSGGESAWDSIVTLFTGNIYNISNSHFVFLIVVPSFSTTQPLPKLAMPGGLLCVCWAQVCVNGMCMWGGMWPKVIPHKGDLAQWKIPQRSTAQIPSLHFKSAGSGLGIHTDSSTLRFRDNHGLFSRSECISKGAGVNFQSRSISQPV